MTFSSRFIGVGFLFWYFPLVNPLMTRYAERHQIALIMCAAFRNRSDVMHKRCANVSPLLFALLAERMPCQMSVTNPTPQAAIPLALIVPAHKMLVMSLHDFLVRLTVATLPVRKVRAARHTAGSLRLSRHHSISIKKALSENCVYEKADSISYSC